jgi:ribonuclease BN (tRNA processing enzyme)
MCDVGDGLNLFIDHDMMVDYGGEKEKLKYRYHHRCCRYCYPFHPIETFVLSHFHEDHYNGLFLEDKYLQHHYFHSLQYVYYQGIPIIVDEHGNNIHTQFLSYLMAMNHYMLGDQSGLASTDLISRLQQLSQNTFQFAPLFKGDTFTYGGRKY